MILIRVARLFVAVMPLTVGACSSSGSAAPDGGGGSSSGSSSGSGGSSGSGSSSGSSSGNASSADASAGQDGAGGDGWGDGGVCNNVAVTAQATTAVSASGTLPQPQGGTIADGTYNLTSDAYYPGSSPSNVGTQQTITLVVSGTTWQVAGRAPGTGLVTLTLQVTTSGTGISATFTCNSAQFQWTGYTVTSTGFMLISTTKNEVQTWVKQ